LTRANAEKPYAGDTDPDNFKDDLSWSSYYSCLLWLLQIFVHITFVLSQHKQHDCKYSWRSVQKRVEKLAFSYSAFEFCNFSATSSQCPQGGGRRVVGGWVEGL
jgi:hypothetical protein